MPILSSPHWHEAIGVCSKHEVPCIPCPTCLETGDEDVEVNFTETDLDVIWYEKIEHDDLLPENFVRARKARTALEKESMKKAQLDMSGDRESITFIIDGRTIVHEPESTKEIIDFLKGEGVTHVEAFKDKGATGLYGDLSPGIHTLEEYEEWLIFVGGE